MSRMSENIKSLAEIPREPDDHQLLRSIVYYLERISDQLGYIAMYTDMLSDCISDEDDELKMVLCGIATDTLSDLKE